MSKPAPSKPDDFAWEKQHSPVISKAYWGFVVVAFIAWVGFLVAMTIHRWVMTLQ